MICGVKDPADGTKCDWTLHQGDEHSWGKPEHCPDCGSALILKWSGVKCSACAYWFCY